MKQVLVETQPFQVKPIQLTEGLRSPAGNPIVEGILATSGIKNGNGRYYAKDLWQREIDKYEEKCISHYSRYVVGWRRCSR